MLPLLVAALLGACGLFIVLAPLFAPGRLARPAADGEAGGLVEREASAKLALREVEFDHQLGNLAEDDYRALRERYTRRALAAMKGRYDHERALDDLIETQVRALRDASAAATATTAARPAAPRSPSASASTRRAASNGTAPRPRNSSGGSNGGGASRRRKGRG